VIANQKQYKITLERLTALQSDLARFSEIGLVRDGIDPIIVAAQRRSLESESQRLESDIARYNALREGRVDALKADDIAGLGNAFIEARLALGLTQKELASRLQVKEQQIQRYEQERYQSASLARLQEVARALETESAVELKLPERLSSSSGVFEAKRLPIREMKKRGWLRDIRLPAEAPRTDLALAESFMRNASAGGSVAALHRQRVRTGGKLDPYAISAWKARVLQVARKRVRGNYRVHPLDALFIQRLVRLSAQADGPVLALEELEAKGVIVVVEERLTGTHLDGAAMLLDNHIPVIGLTLRHDRLDNFWFVLMHELAHVVCHRDRGLAEGFFDDEGAPSVDELEKEADDFALNVLIPDEVWKSSFVRFTKSADQVENFARKLGISPSIVAGRIRHERKDYKLFSDLVGGKEVRKLFIPKEDEI
jgi:HTH-type transcriptional regulator/antitoxin HigA